MITDYVTRYGEASKKDIRNLLLGKLPDILSESQKEWKVSNLITKLAKIRSIEAVSGKTNAKKDRIWKLIKN